MPDAKTSNLEFRERQTSRYGARTMDQIFAELVCSSCNLPVTDPGVRPVEFVDYGTVEELLESAQRVAKAVVVPPTACVGCGGKPRVVHFDYHTYSSALGGDLVVRCLVKGGLFGGYKVETWVWSLATGYRQLPEMPPEVARRFGRDASLRKAWTTMEVGGVRQGFAQIDALSTQLAGDKALLEFLPPLLSIGKAALAARIAQAHVDSWPNDPAGHYWLAEILIQAVAHGAVNASRLDEAARLLERSLAVDSSYGPALTARANLPRLRGDPDGAMAALMELVAVRPELADAHFNLGVMTLDHDPATALQHFERAEEAAPEEADYALGRARALHRLGRADLAAEALQRGRELAPDHPRVRELEQLLGQRRG